MIFMSESLRSSSSAYYNEIGNRVGSIICDNFQLEVAMYLCSTPRLLCSLILFIIQSILVWPHVSSSVYEENEDRKQINLFWTFHYTVAQ